MSLEKMTYEQCAIYYRSQLNKADEEIKNLKNKIDERDIDIETLENERDRLKEALSEKINGQTSDGYHTFNELYEHRCLLWLNLVLLQHPKMCYVVEDHHPGWFILGVETPFGQLSYHLQNKLLNFVVKIERRHPEFDGHTSSNVIERLSLLAKQALQQSESGK